MTTLTAHSNPDGTYTGTFALRTGSFDNFKSAADYESFIRANFVGVPEDWVPQIAAQVAAAPANSQGAYMLLREGQACVRVGQAPVTALLQRACTASACWRASDWDLNAVL